MNGNPANNILLTFTEKKLKQFLILNCHKQPRTRKNILYLYWILNYKKIKKSIHDKSNEYPMF